MQPDTLLPIRTGNFNSTVESLGCVTNTLDVKKNFVSEEK